MSDRIIYVDEDGSVVVIVPTPEILQTRTIQEVAQKDVPSGRPYKIVPLVDIPEDRVFRNAWEVDESILTDGVGAISDEWQD